MGVTRASKRTRLKLKAQVMVGEEIAFGPGKADLLDAIDKTGSISAAAREMGLSYRRAWMMVDAMNRLFSRPLVATVSGGRGGASVTETGCNVLACYREMQKRLSAAATECEEELLTKIARTPTIAPKCQDAGC